MFILVCKKKAAESYQLDVTCRLYFYCKSCENVFFEIENDENLLSSLLKYKIIKKWPITDCFNQRNSR
jgi:hypothetical protein